MKSMPKISMLACLALSCAQAADEVKLNEVTVTSATGFEQNIKDAPASVSVISQKEIAKRNHQDIESIVKDAPGVFGATLGAASRRGITMRGLGQKYTKILIDGRPATSDSAYRGLRAVGSAQNFLPPANTIERIEIVRGPMSSLYGSDAMGGVINIITKGFSNEFSGNVNGYYTLAGKSGINDDYQTGFYANGAVIPDVLGIALYGRYFHKFEDERAFTNRKNEDVNFGAKIMYNATENDEIALDLRRVVNKYERTEGKTLNRTASDNTSVAFEKMSGYTASLSHTGKYDKLLLESFLMHDNMKESGQQDLTLKTTTLNTKGTYFFDNNTLSLGAEYRRERLNEKATTADAANVKRYDFSLYGEDDFDVTDALTLTAGLRYNHDKDYGGHVSPRGYAVYHLSENLSLKGGVSAGYATPDIKMRTDGLALPFAGGMGAQLGKSDLKPESSLNYEAGVAYGDESLNVSAMAFYTRIKDGLGTKPVCVARPGVPCVHNGKTYRRGIWESVNIGKAEVKGVELASDWQILSNLALHSSYVYTKSKQKSGAYEGKSLNNLPVHTVKIGLDYDMTPDLNLWTQMNYLGKTRAVYGSPGDEEIRDYTLFDAGASYKLTKNASVNFSVYNIFNEYVTTKSGRYEILIADGVKYRLGFNVNF